MNGLLDERIEPRCELATSCRTDSELLHCVQKSPESVMFDCRLCCHRAKLMSEISYTL
jgi:hypothetical protein